MMHREHDIGGDRVCANGAGCIGRDGVGGNEACGSGRDGVGIGREGVGPIQILPYYPHSHRAFDP